MHGIFCHAYVLCHAICAMVIMRTEFSIRKLAFEDSLCFSVKLNVNSFVDALD
jgi:hypothetical protein